MPRRASRASRRSWSWIRARPTARSRSSTSSPAAGCRSGSSTRTGSATRGRSSSPSIEAREPWVLSVDADEWLDDDLRADLPRLVAADASIDGWRLRRTLTLYGSLKPVSLWTRPEHIVRLVRRGRARFDEALIVHEGLIVEGRTEIAARGPPAPRARPSARRADAQGDRLREAQGGAAARARAETLAGSSCSSTRRSTSCGSSSGTASSCAAGRASSTP